MLNLPKPALQLVADLDNAGWSFLVQREEDNGGSPFVTIKGAPSWDPYSEVIATWHTRSTGTYRLFSCMAGRGARMRDVSLKEARALITPRPADAPNA